MKTAIFTVLAFLAACNTWQSQGFSRNGWVRSHRTGTDNM